LQIGCLPYFYTWCGLSANLECRSEMCCTRLAGNTGCKNHHLCTVAQLCRAVSSQLRCMYWQSFKVKSQGHQGQKTAFFGPFGGLRMVYVW